MGFKFQPGDKVYVVDSDKMSDWTRIRTGTIGVVDQVHYEDESDISPVLVHLRLSKDQVPSVWWVYESEIDFVTPPIPVDVDSLL